MAGRWSFSGPNPIIGYTVGFELGTFLTSDVMSRVSALGPSLANDLPRKVEQVIPLAIPFAPFPGQPQTPGRAIAGILFDEMERDGTVLKQLSVTQNSVTYRTARYERWKEYWPVAERILSHVAGVVLPDVPISGFVLNAVNKFSFTGDRNDIPMDELIRAGCQLVASDILTKRGPCHSFYGYMTPSSDPEGKRIDNINIAVNGTGLEGNEYWVEATFNVRLVLNSQITEHHGLFGESSTALRGAAHIFQAMRASNNTLFGKVLRQEIRDRIPEIPGL